MRRAAPLVLLAIGLTGCAAGGGWLAAALVVFGLSGLALSGCSAAPSGSDAGRPDSGGWDVQCCVYNRIETCHCVPEVSCNYSRVVVHCGDGYCVPDGNWSWGGSESCPIVDGGADASLHDGGGRWEPCCVDGRIDSCYCPADTVCSYGPFDECADGTCASPGSCGVDAGAADAD